MVYIQAVLLHLSAHRQMDFMGSLPLTGPSPRWPHASGAPILSLETI